MRKCYLLLLVLSALVSESHAQESDFAGMGCAMAKQKMSQAALAKRNLRYPGDATVDVGYYFLNLSIEPERKFLRGKVQINLASRKENLNSFFLDLNSSFKVDSVVVNDLASTFSHTSGKLTVNLKTAAGNGDILKTIVYYSGVPVQNNQSYSVEFTYHNGQPVIWTLSEPYDAPSWFPCVDNQADKADSCDVWITLPSYFTAVSQGLLQEIVSNPDGTNTTKWKHRYPVAQYLISIAASNYVKQERYFHHSATDSMLVVDYLYPEISANPVLKTLLDRNIDMLGLFSEKYGEYPFVKENTDTLCLASAVEWSTRPSALWVLFLLGS